ncbi:hypothetical protein ACJMK2_039464 [Sinanodonta woodiana]|uniref:Protein C10 n=1 Tax=Sinanodonta woodiana TaxID=1069815 RepID=A0ABD3WFG5_SINWO
MAASIQHFSVQDCKAALGDILVALQHPDNVLRLDEARESSGNDMLRSMQLVFPLATQIEMEVIEKYGFQPDGDGLIRFTQAVKVYEKQDPEIAQLNRQLKSILIPGLPETVAVTNTNGAA